MNKPFTASEVRELAVTMGAMNLPTTRDMLYAYADRLEADEKAQAQPPAVSVTDAMIMRAVKAWTSNGFGNPGQVFSIYSVAKVMLEAALAAQENLNGGNDA